MAHEKIISDTGRLLCDNIDIADVEFTLTVRRSELDGRTSESGFLRGDMDCIDSCRNAARAELATRHFGRILIQIHRIDEVHALFDLVEPVGLLGVDPPCAPDLAAQPEEPVHGSSG